MPIVAADVKKSLGLGLGGQTEHLNDETYDHGRCHCGHQDFAKALVLAKFFFCVAFVVEH